MKKIIITVFVILASVLLFLFSAHTLFRIFFTSFDFGSIIKHFDDHCITTDDGFRYYNEDSEKGAFILEIPEDEELVIPEYLNQRKVVELGHCDTGIGYMNEYVIIGTNTKTLTVQHQFTIRNKNSFDCYVDFPNLTKLIFIDFLYCNNITSEKEITVPYYIGKENPDSLPMVELRKSEREFSLVNFEPKVIVIPEYVRIIEKDVFAGLSDVIIKTSYESQPEGWEAGWNGSCEVMWGIETN